MVPDVFSLGIGFELCGDLLVDNKLGFTLDMSKIIGIRKTDTGVTLVRFIGGSNESIRPTYESFLRFWRDWKVGKLRENGG